MVDAEAVVLTGEGSYRFEVAGLVPAWTLWAGAAPVMKTGAPGATMRRLREIGEALMVREPEPVREEKGAAPKVASDPGEARLREAGEAEMRGDLEGGGEASGVSARAYRAAGRMYERGGARRWRRRGSRGSGWEGETRPSILRYLLGTVRGETSAGRGRERLIQADRSIGLRDVHGLAVSPDGTCVAVGSLTPCTHDIPRSLVAMDGRAGRGRY